MSTLLYLFVSLLVCQSLGQSILQPSDIKPYMYTEQITGILEPLKPTKLGFSKNYHLPVDTYQITAMRAKLQLLPKNFPATNLFAYGGKVNGTFQPQFPGPYILAFSDTPIYVIWQNDLEGQHFLPIDYNPPFEMLAKYKNDIPTVVHLHGLETEMGSDGQPMAFWTKSGLTGDSYFTLTSSSKKKNQAIYRYYNTKEGLYWYHDHAMGMTRINVYSGLAGLYEIINPRISSEEENILKLYGNVERRHFAVHDKTFNTDGSLFYPATTFIPGYTSWVPGFFGNTFLVNGKVWPKMTVQPKKYRFFMMNQCQSRMLEIYFDYNGTKLPIEIFRRDSDFLKRPVSLSNLLLLNGGRVEFFVDFTNVTGSVLLRNNASTPFPVGAAPDEFSSQIMKINVNRTKTRNLAEATTYTTSSAESKLSLTRNFIDQITTKMTIYNTTAVDTSIDFIDDIQGAKLFLPASTTTTNGKSAASTVASATNRINQVKNIVDTPIQIITPATAKIRASIGNAKNDTTSRIPVGTFINNLTSNPLFNSSYWNNYQPNKNINITNVPYPRFPEGAAAYTVLVDLADSTGALTGLFVDGLPLSQGCNGAYYKQDQIIDYYFVNLVFDDHPIHIHLVNFQVIGRFGINETAYRQAWYNLNGGNPPGRGFSAPPKQLDPRPFKTTDIQPPEEHQKQFMDVIRTPTNSVTIARAKMANQIGEKFPFDISGMRYVFHCHILEHEDNEMMRYFCIE